jgi:hypothetical protein
LKLDLGRYYSAVPDRLKVEIATRRATSPAQEEPSQRNNDVPKIRFQLLFVIFASSCVNFLGRVLSPTFRIQASLRDAGHVVTDPGDKSPGYYHLSLRDWPFGPHPEGVERAQPGVSTPGTPSHGGAP